MSNGWTNRQWRVILYYVAGADMSQRTRDRWDYSHGLAEHTLLELTAHQHGSFRHRSRPRLTGPLWRDYSFHAVAGLSGGVLLNNQTLVLGELIQTTRTYNKIGIPYLNRIPVLGYLRELLLLITPRAVGTRR